MNRLLLTEMGRPNLHIQDDLVIIQWVCHCMILSPIEDLLKQGL